MPERRIGIFSQLVPPATTWTPDEVPDQTGRVAMITGYVGVGKETARARPSLSLCARYALLADLFLP